MAKGLFITATGTDIGKTYVTGLIVKKLREAGISAGYYKAALSGAELRDGERIPGDADHVKRTAGLDDDYQEMVSYIYDTAVSPHLAAKLEGNPAELSKVREDFEKVCEKYDYVTAEGSGGIVCPIRWDEQKILLEDVIRTLDLPILIVADGALGTINSVVLTVSYAREKKIPVKGILLNRFHPGDVMEEDNKSMIEQITGVPVVGVVEENDESLSMDVSKLLELYE